MKPPNSFLANVLSANWYPHSECYLAASVPMAVGLGVSGISEDGSGAVPVSQNAGPRATPQLHSQQEASTVKWLCV